MVRVGNFVVVAVLAAATFSTATGCRTILHELQPHRLWRLNRGSAPPQNDAMFSVSDRIPGGEDVTDSARTDAGRQH